MDINQVIVIVMILIITKDNGAPYHDNNYLPAGNKYGQDFGKPISIVFGYNQDHDHHDHLIFMISKIVINPNYNPT